MSLKLKTIFMGTPEFAVPSLEMLAKHTNVKLVITQPDRPVGRGKKMHAPPVKEAALALGLEVMQPDVVKGKRFSSRIAAYEPDVIITAAFGRILGPSLLQVPRLRCVNVHASLLPAYRGAAPINWAIINGDNEAGVTIMEMVTELDAGDVLKMSRVTIGEQETAGELTSRLAVLGAETLIDVLGSLEHIRPTPQDGNQVTWAPVMKKSDGQLDWKQDAHALHCRIRGMHPWPCTTTRWNDAVIKIHKALVLSEGPSDLSPGTIIAQSKEGIDVACGTGVLRLVEIQLPGKKRLHASQFYAGTKFQIGTQLG